ncbi:hypothetical protein GCM10027258_41610 [Amycolatopsis stemonae]
MTDSVLTGQAVTEDLLIDRFLPRYDVTLIEHVVVGAGVEATWRAVRELDLLRVRSPLTGLAIYARHVPATLARRARGTGADEPPPRLVPFGAGPGLPGWLRLGETPGREVVLGAVGRFWQPDIEWYDVREMTPEAFARFTEPGWGRIAAAISLRPYGRSHTLVTYEARTATADPASAQRFARYWTLVRPFVRVVMRAALRTVRRDAESPRGGSAPSGGPVHRWSRRQYRGARPHGVARLMNRGDAVAYGAGALPHRGVTLEVPGRTSGRLVKVPLVVADLAGERYLVAMLGDRTQWVRNVHAAGGHAVLRHGRAEPVRLEAVPPGERPPVLRRYLAVAPGARPHIPVDRHAPLEEFGRIAADFPVFRIVPEPATAGS